MNVTDVFKHCQSLGPKIPWDTLTDSQDDFKRFLYFFCAKLLGRLILRVISAERRTLLKRDDTNFKLLSLT